MRGGKLSTSSKLKKAESWSTQVFQQLTLGLTFWWLNFSNQYFSVKFYRIGYFLANPLAVFFFVISHAVNIFWVKMQHGGQRKLNII